MSHCVFHAQLFILIFYVLKLAFIDKHDPPPLCGSEILPIQRNQSINQSTNQSINQSNVIQYGMLLDVLKQKQIQIIIFFY